MRLAILTIFVSLLVCAGNMRLREQLNFRHQLIRMATPDELGNQVQQAREDQFERDELHAAQQGHAPFIDHTADLTGDVN
jgi:hypothetical protein